MGIAAIDGQIERNLEWLINHAVAVHQCGKTIVAVRHARQHLTHVLFGTFLKFSNRRFDSVNTVAIKQHGQAPFAGF